MQSTTNYTPPPDGKRWTALLGLLHFDFSGSEFRLALYLIHKANPKTGQCNPGAKCIMADTGMAERTIKRARAGLRRKGIIRSKQRHRSTSNDYWINWRTLVGKVRPQYSASTRAVMGVLKKADRASAAGIRPNENVKDFAVDVCGDYEGWSGDPIGGLAKRIAEDT
jgi:hypothetical protein